MLSERPLPLCTPPPQLFIELLFNFIPREPEYLFR